RLSDYFWFPRLIKCPNVDEANGLRMHVEEVKPPLCISTTASLVRHPDHARALSRALRQPPPPPPPQSPSPRGIGASRRPRRSLNGRVVRPRPATSTLEKSSPQLGGESGGAGNSASGSASRGLSTGDRGRTHLGGLLAHACARGHVRMQVNSLGR
ncbi:Protein of unknown function, partial [Gryllus bimaculatus]